MELISKYRSYFAKKVALKISAAATLSICFALLLGFNGPNDFAWFAPFSVVISLLMFPHQSSRYQIVIQRLCGITLAAALALLGAVVFEHHQIGLIIYTVTLTLIFTYLVGKNYKYNYMFFLTFIFLNVLVCFALVQRQHFYAAVLHFPFMVLIAVVSLLISEIFVPGNAVKKKAPEMLQNSFSLVREHLADLTNLESNISWFYYFERLLLTAKSQLKSEQYNFYINNCKTLRVISIKLNYIAQHLKKCEQVTVDYLPELKNITRLLDIALKTLSENKEPNYDHLNDAIDILQQRFNKSEHANNTDFIFVVHEFKYILEEMHELNSTKTHPTADINNTSGFFDLRAIRFAVQVTATVAFTIAAILYLKIPGGYQTLIAGIVIAATPHTGALIMKFFMRMAGILFGGLCALIFGLALMRLDSMVATIAVMTIFVYFCAWWAIRYEKFTYVGIQAGLMFIMLLLADGGHYLAIAIGEQRFEGVILGSLIALTINLILAPELPSRYVKKTIKKAINNAQTCLQNLINSELSNKEQQEILLQQIENQIEEVESVALLQYLNPKKKKITLLAVEQLRTMFGQLRRLTHLLNAQEKVVLPNDLITEIKEQTDNHKIITDLQKHLSDNNNVALAKVMVSLNIIFENLVGLNKVVCNTKCK